MRIWPGLLATAFVPSVLLAVQLEAPADGPATAAERMRADVKYLAHDRLEGRGIGTRGEELTVEYLAGQFAKAGLKPAGDNGAFFQRVSLLRMVTDPATTLVAFKGEEALAFRCGEDFAGHAQTQRPLEEFDAEALFVGHGITAPEFGWDDYRGLDVNGKVVVLFTNEPPSNDARFFGGRALTYYGRWTFKFEEAARRGAKAALIIHTNETAGYPFSVVQTLEGAQLPKAADAPALAFAGWLSRQAGERLLARAGLTVDDALKQAGTRGFKPVPLGERFKARISTEVRKVVTRNVLGLIEGRDPARKDEAVMFTAHWDHLGVGKSVLGDSIYNGAADNATGCAILLELARAWAAQQPLPRRSALFLATTAEESGLLGAHYYARNPTVPLGKTAINLNFDMILPLGSPESVVVGGAERTTAWPIVQAAARKSGLDIEPDTLAHLGMYYRSDHFALARAGVPAFKVSAGERIKGKPADHFSKAVEEFIAKTYHSPQDEFREEWDFSGFEVLVRFALDVGRAVADAEALPTWMPGDEFLPAREKSGVKAGR